MQQKTMHGLFVSRTVKVRGRERVLTILVPPIRTYDSEAFLPLPPPPQASATATRHSVTKRVSASEPRGGVS